jgi:RES domain-containing protein
MVVFRIARGPHASDLTGLGARSYGGRWNRNGTAVVYTSTSPALATVESLVHVDFGIQPRDLRMVSIDLPDDAPIESIDAASLPANWKHYPAPQRLADIGSEWVASGRTLLLRVPSAVVDREVNVLVNPAHARASDVRIVGDEPFAFDPRLLGKGAGGS